MSFKREGGVWGEAVNLNSFSDERKIRCFSLGVAHFDTTFRPVELEKFESPFIYTFGIFR